MFTVRFVARSTKECISKQGLCLCLMFMLIIDCNRSTAIGPLERTIIDAGASIIVLSFFKIQFPIVGLKDSFIKNTLLTMVQYLNNNLNNNICQGLHIIMCL